MSEPPTGDDLSSAPTTGTGTKPGTKPGFGPLLWILATSVTALTVVFGVMTLKNHARFSAYQVESTVQGDVPSRWQVEALSVEQCIDESLAWAEGCPGVQSWCEGQLPRVLEACLASQPRDEYCAKVGDEVASTRFGFELCASRYNKLETYARRSRKKFCARSLRTVADHCISLAAGGLEAAAERQLEHRPAAAGVGPS